MLCKDWGNGTEKGGRVREEEKKRKGWREGEPMPQGPPERSSSRVCSLNDRLLTVQSSAPWRLLRGAVPESPHLKNPLSHSHPLFYILQRSRSNVKVDLFIRLTVCRIFPTRGEAPRGQGPRLPGHQLYPQHLARRVARGKRSASIC